MNLLWRERLSLPSFNPFHFGKKRKQLKKEANPSIFSRSGRKIDWIGFLSLTALPLGAPFRSFIPLPFIN